MSPLQSLMEEHRVIERVLDALERYVERSHTASVADCQAELLQFVEFIQKFADKCHHGKEEDILFTEMVEAGFPREAGPLGVMLHEHEQGRAFVHELKRLGEQESPWTDADREELSRAASGYISLLRQHIRKEDGVLYPMAESNLPADAMKSIGQRFREFEQSEARAGEHERLNRLADELAGRYLNSAARWESRQYSHCAAPPHQPARDKMSTSTETREPKPGAMPPARALRLGTLADYGEGAIVSRTLAKGPAGSLTVFAFDKGQELSEHSTPFDAYITVLDGEALLVIGGNEVRAKVGESVRMPAGIPHAVKAPERFKMLLVMLRNDPAKGASQ